MTTAHVRGDANGSVTTPAATTGQERHGLLREWIESLGPAAVVTFLTHDDYEREQLQAPPALSAPAR